MEVWREAAQFCPPSPLPSRARIEVPQCRPPVPEIHTSPGVPRWFFFFPKEKEATRAATCTAHRLQRRLGRCKTRRQFSPFGVFIPFFLFFCSRGSCRLRLCPALSLRPSLRMKAALAVFAQSEGERVSRRRISSPTPLPPPSIAPSPPSLHAVHSVLFPRWLSFTVSLPDKPGEARRAGPRQGFSLWLQQQQPPHPISCLPPAMLCMRQVLNGEEGCVCVCVCPLHYLPRVQDFIQA